MCRDEEVERQQILHGEEPHEQRDVHELERGERVDDRVERPVAESPSRRLAALVAARRIEHVRDATSGTTKSSATHQRCGPVARKSECVAREPEREEVTGERPATTPALGAAARRRRRADLGGGHAGLLDIRARMSP